MKQYMLIFNEDMKLKLSLVFGSLEFIEVVGMHTKQAGMDYSVIMTPIHQPVPGVANNLEPPIDIGE